MNSQGGQTDHLRKFYENFKGFITCDAYCAYQTLEKEKQDVITVCGCMMHMRRRFVQSLVLIHKDGINQDTVDMLPETQALTMIGKIYDADEKLKDFSAKERSVQIELNVRPLVEQFYSYIDTLNVADPAMNNRLKDAVNYAQNQKKICADSSGIEIFLLMTEQQNVIYVLSQSRDSTSFSAIPLMVPRLL